MPAAFRTLGYKDVGYYPADCDWSRRRRRTFTIDGTKLDPPAYLAP
jgi:hypothetical protein